MKFDWKAVTFPQERSFQSKKFFLWLANTGVKPPYFKISRLKLQKLLKSCWPSKTEHQLRWVICWVNFVRLPHIVKDRLWNMAKSTRISEFHSCAVFSTRALLSYGCHANVNFAISSNNLDQLRDLNNYLNQKVITAINTLYGSSLGDDLIMCHQNDQDYLVDSY